MVHLKHILLHNNRSAYSINTNSWGGNVSDFHYYLELLFLLSTSSFLMSSLRGMVRWAQAMHHSPPLVFILHAVSGCFCNSEGCVSSVPHLWIYSCVLRASREAQAKMESEPECDWVWTRYIIRPTDWLQSIVLKPNLCRSEISPFLHLVNRCSIFSREHLKRIGCFGCENNAHNRGELSKKHFPYITTPNVF